MNNVAYGLRPCGERLAIDIERQSGGQVTVEELRPDLAEHWAYLRGSRNVHSGARSGCPDLTSVTPVDLTIGPGCVEPSDGAHK